VIIEAIETEKNRKCFGMFWFRTGWIKIT